MDYRKVLFSPRLWVVFFGVLLCLFFAIRTDFFVSREAALDVYRGRVLSADDLRLEADPSIAGLYIGRQTLEIELLDGDFAGQRFRIENTLSRFFNIHAHEGMELLLFVNAHGGMVSNVEVFGYSRGSFLTVFVLLFAVVLIAVGRAKGVYAVLSLAFTLAIVVFFMLPLIIEGYNPVVLAIITAAFTAVFSITLVGGASYKSIAAISGTVLGVLVAGTVGIVAGRFASISGMQMEHASEVIYQGGRDMVIRVPLLLFSGIIIASLGAVIDVGMSISSAVFEVKKVNPALGFKHLYKSGMSVGKDIIGTMSNTLILAFAGSSIVVIVIIALYELPFLRLVNMDLLAIEVVFGLSASLGLVFTVPITAGFAAYFAAGKKLIS